jgi:hypothetical protein
MGIETLGKGQLHAGAAQSPMPHPYQIEMRDEFQLRAALKADP